MHCYVLDNFWPPTLEMQIRCSSQGRSVPQRHYKYSFLPLDTALVQIINSNIQEYKQDFWTKANIMSSKSE